MPDLAKGKMPFPPIGASQANAALKQVECDATSRQKKKLPKHAIPVWILSEKMSSDQDCHCFRFKHLHWQQVGWDHMGR
jgi:hypothetical protein